MLPIGEIADFQIIRDKDIARLQVKMSPCGLSCSCIWWLKEDSD